jgi:hypothetical protein
MLGELLTEPVSVADQLPMTTGNGGVFWGLGIMERYVRDDKGLGIAIERRRMGPNCSGFFNTTSLTPVASFS